MIAALASGPAYASGVQPNTSIFLNPGVTPIRDLIAWPLIKNQYQNGQNSVVASPAPTAVTPPPVSSLSGFPVPTGAAVGLLSAIKNPNMSQATPDCAPPPTPQPADCSCGGYAGTVTWSGWDQVSGGTCNGGGAGGWLTTQGGCDACPPPPPSAYDGGNFSLVTGYSDDATITVSGDTATRCNALGVCETGTVTQGANGTITISGLLNGDGTTETITVSSAGDVTNMHGDADVGNYSLSTDSAVLYVPSTVTNAAGEDGQTLNTTTSDTPPAGSGAVAVGSATPGL